jgi:hypothetical protein
MTEVKSRKFDLGEFLRDGKPAVEFNEVTEQIHRENDEELIDKIRLKRDRAWSYLANRMVGTYSY